MNYIERVEYCILVCLLLICSCTNSEVKKKSNDASIRNDVSGSMDTSYSIKDTLLNRFKGAKYFSYKKNIKAGVYMIDVETFYKNDTLAGDIPLFMASPIIINQKLTLKKNDSLIKEVKLPSKKIEKYNKSGVMLEIPETSIWLIYSMKGIGGNWLFGIEGSALCQVGDCPEYCAILSDNGVFLSQCHYLGENKRRYPCLEQKILKKYGITRDEFSAARDEGTVIDIWR